MIIEYCQDKERVVLDSFMLKRRLDERNNICKLTEIVSMEIGNKFSYDRINSHKPVEERFLTYNNIRDIDDSRFIDVQRQRIRR